MRKITLAAAAVAAAAALVVPATANAATTADTNVTFSINGLGGALSITGTLGSGAIVPVIGQDKQAGTLGTVNVTDNRNGSPRQYTVTASSTDFTSGSNTIPKSAVKYSANAVAGQAGGGSLSSTGEQTLDTPKVVLTRTGLTWPLELSTYTQALGVEYPGGAPIGTYTGVITVSVA